MCGAHLPSFLHSQLKSNLYWSKSRLSKALSFLCVVASLPSRLPAFQTRVLQLHHSIFSGSKLSRSIPGEVTQHRNSFWVYREILSVAMKERKLSKITKENVFENKVKNEKASFGGVKISTKSICDNRSRIVGIFTTNTR